MLIHELSIAVQRDRERAMRQALAARRHLSGVCSRRGLVARIRAAIRPDEQPRHPRVPAGRPDARPTR